MKDQRIGKSLRLVRRAMERLESIKDALVRLEEAECEVDECLDDCSFARDMTVEEGEEPAFSVEDAEKNLEKANTAFVLALADARLKIHSFDASDVSEIKEMFPK